MVYFGTGTIITRLNWKQGLPILVCLLICSGLFNAPLLAQVGSGPKIGVPVEVVVDANGDLIVMSASVFRIDPVSGNRTVISNDSIGEGPDFSAYEAAKEQDGNVVVVSRYPPAVYRVDLATGNRAIVSDDTTGTGPLLGRPQDIIVDSDGSLLVSDSMLDAILRVDPITGNRTTVSDVNTGSGPDFESAGHLALSPGGELFVQDRHNFLRVDTPTRNRTMISGRSIGRGPVYSIPLNFALGLDGQLYVVDYELAAVFRINPGI